MKKMNNKGYMLVEIILAFVISFAILYFMMDLVIKLKNKNDDLLVETIVKTDSSIVTNKLMEYAISDVDSNDTADEFCNNIKIEGQTIKYGTDVVDIVDNTARIIETNFSCNVDYREGKVSVLIPVEVKQNKDRNFDISMDYNYELEESIIRSYWCANKSEGSEPWDLYYEGNCIVEGLNDINWKVKLLSTGTYELKFLNSTYIDAFLVGGGGGGGSYYSYGGGGGGYTNTSFVSVKGGKTYSINIGSGGAAHTDGQNTTAFDLIAFGGTASSLIDYGATGGSGGGGQTQVGGSDGSNGSGSGGTGQETTTREFGESTGELYSGGGGGGGGWNDSNPPAAGGAGGGGSVGGGNGIENTGGGGSGARTGGSGGTGGSGIVVIRNTRISNSDVSKLPSVAFDFTYTGKYVIVNDGGGNWRIKFLTDGVFKANKNLSIDVFLVGGGGGGGGCYDYGGGGGGYTKTSSVNIVSGTSYTLDIGAGGAGGNCDADAVAGSITTGFGITANGGGASASDSGAAGGSGGGGQKNNGGSDGSAGDGSGGNGQGTTTREFGETGGKLYAGGGGGGRYEDYSPGRGGAGGGGSYCGDGVVNSGGGGAAGRESLAGGSGGSGIIIIRNKR